MDELRSWLTTSLMWDASRDPTALIKEFLEGYYSPAASGYMHSHLSGLLNATKGVYVRDGCRWGPDGNQSQLVPANCFLMPWLTKHAVMNSAASLHAALRAVGGQDPFATRIDRVWRSTQWILLNRWKEFCAAYAGSTAEWPLNFTARETSQDLVAGLRRHKIHWLATPTAKWNASSLLTQFNDSTLVCANTRG